MIRLCVFLITNSVQKNESTNVKNTKQEQNTHGRLQKLEVGSGGIDVQFFATFFIRDFITHS